MASCRGVAVVAIATRGRGVSRDFCGGAWCLFSSGLMFLGDTTDKMTYLSSLCIFWVNVRYQDSYSTPFYLILEFAVVISRELVEGRVQNGL